MEKKLTLTEERSSTTPPEEEKVPSNINVDASENIKYYMLLVFCFGMMGLGFVFQTPSEILEGMIIITTSPGRLVTDYMELTSVGAAFFNGGLLTLLSVLMVRKQKAKFSGPVLAAIFTIFGFSLFGKSLFNTIPITLGVYLYSKLEKRPFSHFLIVSLFGTALGPAVSYLAFGMAFSTLQGILIGYTLGILIGFILPALASHFLSYHRGFSLYNIGFTAGIVGMLIVAFLNMFGTEITSASILSSGNNTKLAAVMFGFCFLLFIIGFYYNGMSIRGYQKILQHSGKLVTDFMLLEGFGKTLINMALQGALATFYVLLVGGQLNGPVIGGIFTIIGFSAFGKHPLNCIPIFIGVYLASILNIHDASSTTFILAALFGTTLAPIAGFYGPIYGIIAGFLHTSLVVNVNFLHGGLNLYNNGFSGGFIAAVLTPIYDALLNIKRGIKHET